MLPTLPTTFLVGALNHPLLRLRQPVALQVAREGEYVMVSVHGWGEWGEGLHLKAAVEDWQQTMADLYLTLQGEQGRLGPAMVELWEQLQGMIEVRDG